MTKYNFDLTDLFILQPHTQCVLIARDPNCIYAYWDYTAEDINRLRNQCMSKTAEARFVLRIYDGFGHSWDVETGFSVKNQYIQVVQENMDYSVEPGITCGEGHFIPLVRSNTVTTPPKTTSKRDDLIWQDIKFSRGESKPYIKEDLKNRKSKRRPRTYQLSSKDIRDYYMDLRPARDRRRFSIEGIESLPQGVAWEKVKPLMVSPDLIKGMHPGASGALQERGRKQQEGQQRLFPEMFMGLGSSETLSSMGASENLSSAGFGGKGSHQRQFFFEVWTELIVHGRTAPDASVWLNQKGIKLRPDGTFSIRYALPDGNIPLNFIAQSSDGVEQRHIQTRVERAKTIGFPKMLKEFSG